MADTLKFTLDEESEKKLFELLTDVDVSKTPSFSIKDKHGNEAEYFKGVRCKDCKYFMGDDYFCEMPGLQECFCMSGKRKEE